MYWATALSFVLLFQLKHVFCDFIWQYDWMAKNKGKPWREALWPLTAHSGVHAVCTFGVVVYMTQRLLPGFIYAAFDFASHFVIDRLKADPKIGGKYKPDQHSFWISLGVDQYAHQCVYLFIVAAIARGYGV